jgi:hypothetical protein
LDDPALSDGACWRNLEIGVCDSSRPGQYQLPRPLENDYLYEKTRHIIFMTKHSVMGMDRIQEYYNRWGSDNFEGSDSIWDEQDKGEAEEMWGQNSEGYGMFVTGGRLRVEASHVEGLNGRAMGQ